MANITRDRAREIVSEIHSQSGGFLGDNEREKALGDVLGARVLEAAAKAWTSDTRFFYELIQNADDCSYTWADSQKKHPALVFEFTPGRILVKSNEDGFEESHVRALCSVGKRTKTGQIGEKGIGFKSLFKVAWKVQIQSGPFCFSLQHREGQNGLGMIAPVNEAHEYLPEIIRTQFTLFLISPEHHLDLRDKLLNFPFTMTAFLRKLDLVNVYYRDGWSTFTKVSRNDGTYLKQTQGYKILRSAEFFYFKKEVPVLPDRERHRFVDSTEMTLAFPLSSELLPAVSCLHAYLPVSGAATGFKFLVQSDFAVQDSREDLAVSLWNDNLLGELPQVFLAALETLSSKQQFEYSWPQFLPMDDIKRPRWAQFHKSVKQDLKHLRIFKTVKGTLKTLEEVRYLLPEHCDSKGNPLFSDSEEDVYLSTQYSDYYGILSTFGLQPISSHQLLHRLRGHLSGILFGKATCGQHLEDDWYTKVASLVLSWMDSPLNDFVKEVEALRLVPVYAKSLFDPIKTLKLFKSPKETDIYFPHDTCGNLIPDSILETVPVANAASGIQKQLFTRLGVKRASQAFVIQCIYALNDKRIFRPGVTQSVQNLRYMFLAAPDGRVIDAERILLYDDAGKVLVNLPHSRTDIYFKTADVYGMSEIYRLVRLHNTKAHRLPSLPVCFLHPSYTTDFQNDTAWKSWLEDTCSIRTSPRLETLDSPGQPSDILRHIVECVPEDLIGVLMMHRNTYENELDNASPATISYLKAALVPTECGKVPLERAFLGLPEMTEIWSDTLKDKFPFLSIPSTWASAGKANWEFLSRFGVTTTLTADYVLESLSRLSQVSPREHAKSGFFKLYSVLADHPFPELWDRVSHRDLIYIPKPDSSDGLVKITDCIWDGPKWSTKYHLAQFDDYTCNTKLKVLFQKVLSQQAPDWQASLVELSRIKYSTVRGSPAPLDIYNYLATDSLARRDWKTIRDQFTLNKYIYIPDKDAWCGPSECVWSAFPITKREYGIRQLYPDLKEFFVHGLGVYTPDVADYVDEIELPVPQGIAPSHISALIQDLSVLNPTAKELRRLELARFLPVRYGGKYVVCVSVNESFLIVDDERFEVDHNVPVLDMAIDAVCHSRPFIAAMNLDSRYLSRQIIEQTRPVDEAEESADLTHALRAKTKFLHRTKGKPDQLFSGATVYTATGFRRLFSLESGLATEVSHEGRVHIEEADGALRIYVPVDPKQRAISYATELPLGLVRLLKICDKEACEAFATVLRESVDILDDILTEKGIIQLSTTGPRVRGLAIRTKNQVGSQKQQSRSSPTPGCMRATRDTWPMRLNASKEYIKELNSSPPYLTTLDRAYSLADTGAEDLGVTSPLFGYLFSKENRHLTSIETAMDWAAQSSEPSWMSLLLGRSEIDDHVIITDSAIEIAVQNEVRGHNFTKRLFEHMRLSGQVFAITEALLEAAAENEGCGRQIMPVLLDYAKDKNGDVTIITEKVLKAAVESTESGDALVSLLLEQPNINVHITEDVVIAAAENEYHGYQIMEQLLKYDIHITVSSAVLTAAAGNMEQGLDITKLLLQHMGDNTPITEDVIISAMRNDIDGLDILNLLKAHHCDSLAVTENILIAATEGNDCHDILEFLGLSKDSPITSAVIEAAAGSPFCEIDDLRHLLDLKSSDTEITEAAMLGDIRGAEKIELLVAHKGHLTEAVLKAAVADVYWPLNRTMLDLFLAHGLQITEGVLVEAAGNPTHGITVVPLLLECEKQIRISENVILAAVTNAGSDADGILETLWDREPDVQISDETLIAAASTDTSSVVKVIELINNAPSRSIHIGESLFEALSGNRTSGAKALRLLLDNQAADEEPTPVTDQALINAAGNTGCGYELMSLLLDYGDIFDLEISISEEVLIAAAGNSLWGLEILVLLSDNGYPLCDSIRFINAVEENIWAGEEIMAFMLRHLYTNDYVLGGSDSSGDEGSTFSGDTEVPEDGDFLEDKNSSGSADGSEEAYETADDG